MSQFNTVRRCTNAAVTHAIFYSAVPYHNRIVDPTLITLNEQQTLRRYVTAAGVTSETISIPSALTDEQSKNETNKSTVYALLKQLQNYSEHM